MYMCMKLRCHIFQVEYNCGECFVIWLSNRNVQSRYPMGDNTGQLTSYDNKASTMCYRGPSQGFILLPWALMIMSKNLISGLCPRNTFAQSPCVNGALLFYVPLTSLMSVWLPWLGIWQYRPRPVLLLHWPMLHIEVFSSLCSLNTY